jgi:squalene-hopene/tetraprenyl-beta-curcumene cyclase
VASAFTFMIDACALSSALDRVRADLASECDASGHWTGELSTSALSTATAVSALALVERHASADQSGRFYDAARFGQLGALICGGLRWLAQHQNSDGGWGDTDRSYSNIATTMLVRAAFHLTGLPANHADMLERADAYIAAQGGNAGLRKRYGRDKTFAAPILTNCALAELTPWSEVTPLPFELAVLPQRWYRFFHLPVVSYAIPALVAIGQARYFHRRPWNPITRLIRKLAVGPSLRVLAERQPTSGGFLEAVPLTSFVVMSLVSLGPLRTSKNASQPAPGTSTASETGACCEFSSRETVIQRGVQFIADSVRPDGSWPIDTNLATWNTTMATVALTRRDSTTLAATSESAATDAHAGPPDAADERLADPRLLDWLLECQHRVIHPYTGAAPGGWGWTDLSGGVPDADDTSGALLALAALRDQASPAVRGRVDAAAAAGMVWLLDLQNRNGGWPTFCRGWGKLPFDRSGADLTAHALRGLDVWRRRLLAEPLLNPSPALRQHPTLTGARVRAATEAGFRYLARAQRPDGAWSPLWFGNQDEANEENLVYGTARVLLAYRDLGMFDDAVPRRGIKFLVQSQQTDGGWGAPPRQPGARTAASPRAAAMIPKTPSSVEETALAIEALLPDAACDQTEAAIERGLAWLIAAVSQGRHRQASPIGFYFARLWYYERLYPLSFAASALAEAAVHYRVQRESAPVFPHV